MRTFNKFLLLSCLILTVLPYVSFSQTVEESAKLKALSAELNQKYQLEHARALEIADSLGLPVRKTYEDGRTILLEKFENGLPVYKTTHNSEGAIMLNTDVVQPGGSTALDLDGNGQTIGIWDAGNPKSNHQQLTGRVNLLDVSSIDGHATHVTGTLIADGTGDAQAKGMAPAAEVDSYDFGNDKTEMSDAASLGLLNSVHPYGYLVGWVFDTVTLKSGASATGWTWRGSASWSEDHNFGFMITTMQKSGIKLPTMPQTISLSLPLETTGGKDHKMVMIDMSLTVMTGSIVVLSVIPLMKPMENPMDMTLFLITLSPKMSS